jgi:AraC-like DNA-binding protein
VKKINLPHTSYTCLVQHLANNIHAEDVFEEFKIPSSFGHGFIRAADIEDGLSVLLTSIAIKESFEVEKLASPEDYVMLHFHEMHSSKATDAETENFKPDLTKPFVFTGVSIVSSLFKAVYSFHNNSIIRSVIISMKKTWLEKLLLTEHVDVLLDCIKVEKENGYRLDMLNVCYRTIIDELLQASLDLPMRNLYIKNRVLLLLEKFLQRQYDRINKKWIDKKISEQEMLRLQVVENKLVNSIYEVAPTINELAKLAAMSSTKLKSLFKKMYELPMYEYYQHHRMQVAKKLLDTRLHSVREVGQQMGYQNISHFAAAFKKIHGILPSSLLA